MTPTNENPDSMNGAYKRREDVHVTSNFFCSDFHLDPTLKQLSITMSVDLKNLNDHLTTRSYVEG